MQSPTAVRTLLYLANRRSAAEDGATFGQKISAMFWKTIALVFPS